MRTFRLSIGHWMALIFLVAVGLATLKGARGWAAGAAYAVPVGCLLLCLVGVAASRGGVQVFWVACAVFGSGYFLHTLRYGTLRPPYLIASGVFDFFDHRYGKLAKVPPFGFATDDPHSRLGDWFRQIANSAAAVLITVLGSLLARSVGAPDASERP